MPVSSVAGPVSALRQCMLEDMAMRGLVRIRDRWSTAGLGESTWAACAAAIWKSIFRQIRRRGKHLSFADARLRSRFLQGGRFVLS